MINIKNSSTRNSQRRFFQGVYYDPHKDKRYKALLKAWNANPDFDFVFSDHSSGEIQSDDIPTVKAALTTKIRAATHTLVIVGVDGNKQHADHQAIGYRNWQNFEVAKSKPNKRSVQDTCKKQ